MAIEYIKQPDGTIKVVEVSRTETPEVLTSEKQEELNQLDILIERITNKYNEEKASELSEHIAKRAELVKAISDIALVVATPDPIEAIK